jgi:hypothetical protein
MLKYAPGAYGHHLTQHAPKFTVQHATAAVSAYSLFIPDGAFVLSSINWQARVLQLHPGSPGGEFCTCLWCAGWDWLLLDKEGTSGQLASQQCFLPE